MERNESMSVRFGIIGLGTIANRFAAVLKQTDETVLEAVASRDMARSEEFALKYNSKKAYDDYEKLIQDKDIDIIYIALTHNFHYDTVKKCLNNNKAVLCEKPLVVTEREGKERQNRESQFR